MRREGLDVQRHFKNKPDKPVKKSVKEISDEKSEASQATFIKRQKQENDIVLGLRAAVAQEQDSVRSTNLFYPDN